MKAIRTITALRRQVLKGLRSEKERAVGEEVLKHLSILACQQFRIDMKESGIQTEFTNDEISKIEPRRFPDVLIIEGAKQLKARART